MLQLSVQVWIDLLCWRSHLVERAVTHVLLLNGEALSHRLGDLLVLVEASSHLELLVSVDGRVLDGSKLRGVGVGSSVEKLALVMWNELVFVAMHN